jgi:hypothetical protein
MGKNRQAAPSIVVTAALVLLAGCTSAAASPSPSQLSSTIPGPTSAVTPSVSPSPEASAGDCVSRADDFTADARGPKGDPVELARAALTGLAASDSLAREDEAGGVVVTIVRGGSEVGRVHFVQDPDGGWLLDGAVLCAGLAMS